MKVWILEKWQTREEMERTYSELEQGYNEMKNELTEDQVTRITSTLESFKKKMEENPNGYWLGVEGKSIYRQFCSVAKDAIRRYDKGTKFRVVEGEIKDDAKYWAGYKFIKENEEVLRYLMATK